MEKRTPVNCPSCSSLLKVQSLRCDNCDTIITGEYALPAFVKLDLSEQKFILDFIMSSGSLKVMAQQLKLSYPTVRNMLDDIIEKVKRINDE